MIYYIEQNGSGWKRPDGTECGLVGCESYVPVPDVEYEECEAETEEEAAQFLGLMRAESEASQTLIPHGLLQ